MRIKAPSPAMVLALLALVVALGGTAAAAGTLIDGSQLKNRSVAGKKLEKNSVTGTEIKESTLGQVPNAASAVTATHAGSADTATHAGTADSATHAGTADTATHAGTADSATHATSADSATNASSATHATTADSATHASSADSATNATNADELGGTSPSGYVHGVGSEFSAGLSVADNAASTNVAAVPGVGTLTATCPGGVASIHLSNGTGATVDSEFSSVVSSGGSVAGGATVTNANTLVSLSGSGSAQANVMLAWPDGAPTHFVDMSIGYYPGPGSTCVIQVDGSAH